MRTPNAIRYNATDLQTTKMNSTNSYLWILLVTLTVPMLPSIMNEISEFTHDVMNDVMNRDYNLKIKAGPVTFSLEKNIDSTKKSIY